MFDGWAPRHWIHDTPMSIADAAAKGMRPEHPFAYNGFRQGWWLLDGAQIRVDALELDGALLVRAVDGARVTLRRVRVANAGWRMEPLSADALVDAATPEVERLRGYRWVADGQREINFDEPGEYVVDDGAA